MNYFSILVTLPEAITNQIWIAYIYSNKCIKKNKSTNLFCLIIAIKIINYCRPFKAAALTFFYYMRPDVTHWSYVWIVWNFNCNTNLCDICFSMTNMDNIASCISCVTLLSTLSLHHFCDTGILIEAVE